MAAEHARDGLALVAQCVAPDCVLEVKRLAPARVRASFRVADGAVDALATARVVRAPTSWKEAMFNLLFCQAEDEDAREKWLAALCPPALHFPSLSSELHSSHGLIQLLRYLRFLVKCC